MAPTMLFACFCVFECLFLGLYVSRGPCEATMRVANAHINAANAFARMLLFVDAHMQALVCARALVCAYAFMYMPMDAYLHTTSPKFSVTLGSHKPDASLKHVISQKFIGKCAGNDETYH